MTTERNATGHVVNFGGVLGDFLRVISKTLNFRFNFYRLFPNQLLVDGMLIFFLDL